MKTKKLYKFLRTGLGSNSGNHTWKIGEWYEEDKVSICNRGFHASKTPLQALGYVGGEILAEVFVRGKSEIQKDKECWSEMKINKAWNWTKKDSVELSIFAAELRLENFEKLFPDDKRPREAIEVARKVLKDDTEENRSTAWSAWSTWSTESAAAVAVAVVWSAAAAKKGLTSKIDNWFIKKIKTLQKYE